MIRVKKIFISIAALLFLSLIIFILNRYCFKQEHLTKNELFIKVWGNVEIYSDDFNRKIEKFISSALSYKNDSASQIVFENLISDILLTKKAKESGYLNFDEVKNYKIEIMSNYIRDKRLKIENIHDWKIKKIITDYNQEIMVDYIWVPSNNKKIADQLFEYVKDGAYLDMLLLHNDAMKWDNAGVEIYKNRIIKVGSMIPEVIEKISKLKPEEIIRLKTKSGYHIIRLINRTQFSKNKYPNYNMGQMDSIRERLAIAQAIENGDLIFNEYALNKEINSRFLNLIDFSIKPLEIDEKLQNDSKIIAEFEGKVYTEQELKTKICTLPQNIQALFRNKPCRIKALATLILIENGCPLVKDRNERIISELKNALNNEEKDTISCLTKWLTNNLINKSASGSLIPILQKSGSNKYFNQGKDYLSKMNPDFSTMVNEEKREYYQWLTPEIFEGLDKLRINFIALENFKLDSTNYNKEQVLAFSGKWKLTVGDFFRTLNTLTPESRLDIAKGDNVIRLIEYMAQDEGRIKNIHNIKINHRLLKEIDIIGYSIDETQPYINENTVIGEFGKIKIDVKMLRKIIAGLDQEENKSFQGNRLSIFRKMLVQAYFLSLKDEYKIENDSYFKRKLVEYENQILFQIFYKKNIYIEPIDIVDTRLNYYVNTIINKLKQERLEKYLNETMKETKIQVNKKLLIQYGINIKNSKFAGQISFF